MKKATGFTFIELIVVISILGILAAVAIPRFMAVQQNARVASVQGIQGALNSAVAIVAAQYKLAGNPAATTVTVDGTAVTVNAATGIPVGTAAGIGNALQSSAGYNADYTTPTSVIFSPQAFTGTASTCAALYNGTTGIVSVSTGGC